MPLGWHTPVPMKVAISLSSFAALHWTIRAAMADDEVTIEEATAVAVGSAGFALTMIELWTPPPFKIAIAARLAPIAVRLSPPVAIVAASVILGTEASAYIDPEDGVENFQKFVSQPTKWISRTREVTVPAIDEEIVQPFKHKVTGFGGFLYRAGKTKVNALQEKVNEELDWALRGLPSIEYTF